MLAAQDQELFQKEASPQPAAQAVQSRSSPRQPAEAADQASRPAEPISRQASGPVDSDQGREASVSARLAAGLDRQSSTTAEPPAGHQQPPAGPQQAGNVRQASFGATSWSALLEHRSQDSPVPADTVDEPVHSELQPSPAAMELQEDDDLESFLEGLIPKMPDATSEDNPAPAPDQEAGSSMPPVLCPITQVD